MVLTRPSSPQVKKNLYVFTPVNAYLQFLHAYLDNHPDQSTGEFGTGATRAGIGSLLTYVYFTRVHFLSIRYDWLGLIYS